MKLFAVKVVMGLVGVFGLALTAHAGLFDFFTWGHAYSVQQNIQYGKTGEEIADLYVPTDTPVHPAIVMVHGGAWVGGDKREGDRLTYAKAFAKAGIAVFSINYRLFNLQTHKNPWPAQIEDAQLAVRWLRAHAANYGIDPKRICAWGDSAGGHLALLLGTMRKTKPGDRSHLYAEQSSTVNCVIDLFGPTDLAAESASTLSGVLVPLFGGKTADQAPEIYADASPVHHVSSKTGPVLILQGLTDNIVLPVQSQKLVRVLSAKGVSHQMITFNGGHWYDKVYPKSQKAQVESQMFEWAKAVLKP